MAGECKNVTARYYLPVKDENGKESVLSFGERFHKELQTVLEKIKVMDVQPIVFKHYVGKTYSAPKMNTNYIYSPFVPVQFIDVTTELVPKKSLRTRYAQKSFRQDFLDEIQVSKLFSVDFTPKPLEIPNSRIFGYDEDIYIPKRETVAVIADPSRYPHQCPRCSAPAYIGLMTVDCSRKSCS